MSDANVETVKGMYEAFGRGDVPAVLAAMTEDVEWHEADNMPYGGPFHGPGAVAEGVFAPLVADIPDFRVTPEEFIASGDQIAVITRYSGTGKATGKQLDMPVIHVFDMRDGKVARFRQFADGRTFSEVARAEAATPA